MSDETTIVTEQAPDDAQVPASDSGADSQDLVSEPVAPVPAPVPAPKSVPAQPASAPTAAPKPAPAAPAPKPEPAPAPAPTPEPTGAGDEAAGDAGDDADDADSDTESSPRNRSFRFTPDEQAFIDKKMGEARTKGRKAAYDYVLSKTGAADLDDLYSLAAEARERRSRDSGQVQDLTRRSTELEQALVQAQQQAEYAHALAAQAIRTASVRTQARDLGFADLDDPIRFLGDMSQFEVDLTTLQASGITEALQQLATEKPYLLKVAEGDAPPAPPIPPSPPGNNGNREENDESRAARRADLGRFARGVF